MSLIYKSPSDASLKLQLDDCMEDGLFLRASADPEGEPGNPVCGYVSHQQAMNLLIAIAETLNCQVLPPDNSDWPDAPLPEAIEAEDAMPEATGWLTYEAPTCATDHLVAERALRIVEQGIRGNQLAELPSGDALDTLVMLCDRAGIIFARRSLECDYVGQTDSHPF